MIVIAWGWERQTCLCFHIAPEKLVHTHEHRATKRKAKIRKAEVAHFLEEEIMNLMAVKAVGPTEAISNTNFPVMCPFNV